MRRHWFEALVAIAAVAGVLEVVSRGDSLREPGTPLWFAVSAIALLILPLLAHRRYPFAAPAALWLVAAAASFVDGQLVISTFSAYVAGLAAAFLLGHPRDAAPGRVGLAVIAASAALLVFNDPDRAPGDFVSVPLLFAIAWLAGLAMSERSARAEAAEQRASYAEREREAAARIAVAEERARIAREHEVFRLIAAGRSNGEIGHELHISETTVKTHVTHILQKLELRDRVQLVVLAYQAGLLEAG